MSLIVGAEGLPAGVLQAPITVTVFIVQLGSRYFHAGRMQLKGRLCILRTGLDLGNLRRQGFFQTGDHGIYKVRRTRFLLNGLPGFQGPAGHVHTGIRTGAVEHGFQIAHAVKLFNIIVINAAHRHIGAHGKLRVRILRYLLTASGIGNRRLTCCGRFRRLFGSCCKGTGYQPCNDCGHQNAQRFVHM